MNIDYDKIFANLNIISNQVAKKLNCHVYFQIDEERFNCMKIFFVSSENKKCGLHLYYAELEQYDVWVRVQEDASIMLNVKEGK